MWWVFQIGAREHYAVARALHEAGLLGGLVTDAWVPAGSAWSKWCPQRMRDRFHEDLGGGRVVSFNWRMGAFEAGLRMRRTGGMAAAMARNERFQELALEQLRKLPPGERITVFSYSYAARHLFRYAKSRGWRTVLGQIDPGPEEERIVSEEFAREGERLGAKWQPAPRLYWELWREEVALADRILVNSEWSRKCLSKAGVNDEKMTVVPLVFCRTDAANGLSRERCPGLENRPLRLLFLGQINLRKGVARMLEAMRLLRGQPIELVLAGPSAVDPSAWVDLPSVKWVGPVPRSHVADYYRSADLFILPTLSDGYALTQLEAMSHGLPVLASRFCGRAVDSGKNGFLIEDLSAEGIAAAILEARSRLPMRSMTVPDYTLKDLGAALRELAAGAER
jgi:glycosyltransferase involved in cell wall biosynthesis